MGPIRRLAGGCTGACSSCPVPSCGVITGGASGSSRITSSRSVRIGSTMKLRVACTVAAWMAGTLAAGAAAPAAAVTDGERTEVNRQFRELFDSKRYAEALPLAERVVQMTEEQYGKEDRALVNPLSN